jgi:4-hydroxy-tetrahydrodipicolinate reductase
MNIALIGYGKMGKTIEPIALERGHNIVLKSGRDGFSAKDLESADVCIEFSSPEVGFDNMLRCIEAGKPVVSGTTGWLN